VKTLKPQTTTDNEKTSVPNFPPIDHPYISNSPDNKGHSLIKLQPLEKMIECALISPYIKNENPISLMIVAKPESGKTSAMKKYRKNKGIIYVTDCTAYGLTRDVLPKMVSGEIKTIIIPDLLTPLSKATKTRKSFVAFLNNLIEEGIVKVTTYAMIWDRNVKANVITAVTDQALFDGRHEWAQMGFISRFLLFTYSYNLSTIIEILNRYSQRGLAIDNKKITFPKKPVNIHLSEQIADQLNPVAIKIGEQCELYGIRAKINLRTLLKSLAYRNNSKEVTDREFKEFLELANFMNFKFNPL